MKRIKLNSGNHTFVDDWNYNWLNQYKWSECKLYTIKQGYKYYRNSYAVATITKNQPPIPMHRLITNCPKEMIVHHINDNELDNRECNLQITNHKINRNKSTYVTKQYPMYHI